MHTPKKNDGVWTFVLIVTLQLQPVSLHKKDPSKISLILGIGREKVGSLHPLSSIIVIFLRRITHVRPPDLSS